MIKPPIPPPSPPPLLPPEYECPPPGRAAASSGIRSRIKQSIVLNNNILIISDLFVFFSSFGIFLSGYSRFIIQHLNYQEAH